MPEELHGLSPDTPVTGPTEATTPADVGATAPTEPTISVDGKTYTVEEAQAQLGRSVTGYRELQSKYDRAMAQLSQSRDALQFAQFLETRPDLRDRFIAEAQKEAGVATPPAEPGKELDPEVAALKREMEGMKQERALEWARGQWDNTRSKFTEIMGRSMSPQEEVQVQQYLDQTGSANLWSATLAVYHSQFMERAATLKAAAAEQAIREGQAGVTEGAGVQANQGPVDWAAARMEDQEALARKMAGGTPDPTYNKYVDFGTER